MSDESEPVVPGDYQHDDVRAVAEYRSVSRASVWAAVLGCASLLAIFSNLLLIIPLLGVVVALAALRQIAGSESAVIGQKSAIIGLALSVIIGTALVTRNVAMNRLVASQAVPWAIEWCELVRAGKFEAALELTRPVGSRRPIDDALSEYYQTNEAAQETMTTFREDPVVKLLADSANDCNVERGEAESMVRDAYGNFMIIHAFTLRAPAGDGGGQGQKFLMHLQKKGPGAQMPGIWHVKSYSRAQ
ncbi:MAG: hypothetical protein ACR2NU_01510 [Aeoliella sp.]